ncbi:hypothetical protein GE061_002987 [Apolygus lucorum]|uniref:ZP domain-containing protein n=1 Tax=Apolygus lucorum TaxID=248454 RepID=A0A8S9X284_APOLU|nr:hypothetical protein GE061_002987 [Apolygus lucorum]
MKTKKKTDNQSTSDDHLSDIECTFGGSADGPSGRGIDSMTARLRRPEGFKGDPLFADDRGIDPLSHPTCRITPDPADLTRQSYVLHVTDFTRCGVLRRNGFVHVRVWFPQFPGVVMMSDQELIIMCKPPEPTIIENKAAGFAGSLPHGARVSGVVEETPGRLEYEVALYKEAPARNANASSNELPVDQAVPIGTKLQLRARINPKSAWKFVKLMEVAVSPDPDDAHAIGSVSLVRNGCRNSDFNSIIPHQPARYRERHNEVFLDFEAFLLSSMRERSTLWIHSQIKACMDPGDCQPDYCLDQYEPAGHGRRRRRDAANSTAIGEAVEQKTDHTSNGTTQYTRFKENIEYTVLMPGDVYSEPSSEANCQNMLLMSAALGSMLFTAAFLMCYLAARLHAVQSQSASLSPKMSAHYPPRSTLT